MELKRKNRVNAEFSMASMTDIIFLLLIFFMITSSAISQSAIDVKLPKATLTTPSVQDPAVVSINEEKPAFTIRADEDTRHKDVVFVMEIAEKHHYNLAIATTQEE